MGILLLGILEKFPFLPGIDTVKLNRVCPLDPT